MKSLRKRNAAFTLIELLVVVAIIALLIAVLIPALGKAKNTARNAATQSQMSGISTACESYYQMFRAYPGFLSETTYGSGVSFSSSQALVVSLSRFFCVGASNPTSFATVSITGLNPSTFVSSDPSVPPRDYSDVTTGRVYTSFLTAPAKDLSGSICLNPTASPLPPLAQFPTYIDSAYGTQALPILYYRAARKYDASVLPVMQRVADSTATPAGFYSTSNSYLGTITSTLSTTAQASNLDKLNAATLDGSHMLTEQINGVDTVRGGYVLISAGTDRQYGTADDIIIAGGS